MTLAAGTASAAEPGQEKELLRTLPQSNHTLVSGIEQVATGSETATEAKFEIKNGALMLSVYTSEKGLEVDAEHNVLKEYIGTATEATWEPEVEVFQDYAHIARSAMYHTLMAMTDLSLVDAVENAAAETEGTVYWVKPVVHDGQPVFEVRIAHEGEIEVVRYDLFSGDRV